MNDDPIHDRADARMSRTSRRKPESGDAPLTSGPASPEDGPFTSREQAVERFAAFTAAALDGRTGPPGEQIVSTTEGWLTGALTDSVEGFGVSLGSYDRQLIRKLAVSLDPVEVEVICSWLRRVGDAVPDLITLAEQGDGGRDA